MSEAHHATQTANAITYSAISAPMMIVIGRAFSIQFSLAGLTPSCASAAFPAPTRAQMPVFLSPCEHSDKAPTPDGQCNQSSLAALFQVRS